MTGVLAAGEGAALAGLITYFLILLIPVLLCIFGIIEMRKKTPDGKRVGTSPPSCWSSSSAFSSSPHCFEQNRTLNSFRFPEAVFVSHFLVAL